MKLCCVIVVAFPPVAAVTVLALVEHPYILLHKYGSDTIDDSAQGTPAHCNYYRQILVLR